MTHIAALRLWRGVVIDINHTIQIANGNTDNTAELDEVEGALAGFAYNKRRQAQRRQITDCRLIRGGILNNFAT